MKRIFARLTRRPWPVAFALGLVLMFSWVWTRDEPVWFDLATRSRNADPFVVRLVELRSAARPLIDRLFHDEWAREVVPHVVSDHEAGEPLSLRWPEGWDPGPAGRDSIIEVLSQPDLVRMAEHDVAIGLHSVSVPATTVTHTQDATLLGSTLGAPFCVRIHSFTADSNEPAYFARMARRRHVQPEVAGDLASRYRADLMGVCTFVHRFGMPGGEVRAWLAARGTSAGDLATYVARGYAARTGPSATADVLSVGGILSGEYLDAGVHAIRRACRSGDRSACMREIFPSGDAPSSAGPVSVVGQDQAMFVTGVRGDILSRLEAEFGSDAFLQFWTSDQPVEAAFEAAFGIHPADWVYRTATALSGVVRAGPLPSAGPAGASVLLMIAGLAIGALAALRRRVA